VTILIPQDYAWLEWDSASLQRKRFAGPVNGRSPMRPDDNVAARTLTFILAGGEGRAIIDATVVIEADDDIGYNPERDRRRFHVLANDVVVVSPDHVSPCFNKDVVDEARLAGSA
jgi:hypothetical protein